MVFGWIANKAQIFQYKTALLAAAQYSGGDHRILTVISCGAAYHVAATATNFLQDDRTFTDLGTGPVDYFVRLSPDRLRDCECMMLQMAEEMQKSGASAMRHMYGLAAGFFSVHKRRDFHSDVSTKIINTIRVGAVTADRLGLRPTDGVMEMTIRANSLATG